MSTNRVRWPLEEPEEPRPPEPKPPRRHLFAWVAAVLWLLPAIIFGAALALVNTDGVHRYLLGLVQRKASESLGAEVRLQDFLLHYETLSVDLYGIRTAGAAPYTNPPLLSIDHINVGVRVVSLFRREWYLDNLQIDHPVAWIVVDKNGVSNIPKQKNSNGNNTDIFTLGIRHFQLTRGEVYFNSKPNALSADLHDVNFGSSFNSLLTKYSGDLAYKNGQLKYGAFAPLNHNLEVKFEATPDVFTLNSGTISIGNSSASISGAANQYRTNAAVQAHYDITADGAQWAKILGQSQLPAGVVKTSGLVTFQQNQNQPLLDSVQLEGDLISRSLAFNGPTLRTEANNLAAHYSLRNGDANLSYLRAELLGGELIGRGAIKTIGGNSHSAFNVELKRISLAALRRAVANTSAARNIALDGVGNATAAATWGTTFNDLIVRSDVDVSGHIANASPGKEQSAVPIDGVVHATYVSSGQELRLKDSYLRSLSTNITMNGNVSKSSAILVKMQANNLGELNSWLAMFSTNGGTQTNFDLAGSANFDGSVRGSISAPHITGQVNAQNLHVNGTDWRALRAGVDLSPSRAALNNVDLQSTTRGRVTCNVGVGLRQWALDRRAPAQVDFNASQMDVATLARISGQPQPVTGTLNAQLHVHGSIENPVGNGNIILNQASVSDQPINAARINLTGAGNEAQARLSVELPSGTIGGQVRVRPQERTFTADLNTAGIDLAKVKALKERGFDAKGIVEAQAHGQGSFDNPEAHATIQIGSMSFSGHVFSKVKLDMNVKNRVADANLSSSVDALPLNAKAHVNLNGDYMADASLDTQAVPIQPLLAAYALSGTSDLSGTTEVHATLNGPLKDKNRLEAHVTIPVLKMAYGNTMELAAASPIHVDYAEGVVHLQPATIRGTDTNLQVQGSIPVNSNFPMLLKAQGAVNLQLAQVFSPGLRSSGELRFNIDATGVGPGGTLGGEIDVVNASVSSADLPVGLQNANGVLKLKTDRLEIASFQGNVGGGTLAAQGALVYRPQMQFDLGVTAKGVRLLYPQGVRETVNGNLRLAGTTESAMLGGSVNLTDVSFTSAFDVSDLIGRISGEVSAPVEQGFTQNLALNISVNSSSYVNLVSRTLSVGGTAALQIRGTAADPVVLGRVNLNGGDIILHGDRFVLTGGTVQFVNPSMTEPVLNVTLTTTIQEYKINLRFNGPANELRTQYTSDPALPPADIINLLAFGHTTEANANNTNNPSVTQQAESLVASQVSSQVTSRFSKAAGISQLSISPVLEGSTTSGPPGAQITIRQRVTGNLFVTFSSNVASTQGQTIQGQYQVTPRVALSATRDPNGGVAVDALIKKTW